MTQTTTQPAAPVVSRGFGSLPCPCCGSDEAISIDLHDFSDDTACRCHGCEEEFPLWRIREIIAKWGRVLSWLASAPELPE